MARVKLTAYFVDNLKPPAKPKSIDIYDSGQPGLVLRCGYGGVKTYRVLWYVNGESRFTKLGRHPTMTLAEARQAARLFLANPQEAIANRPSDTFERVAEDFMTLHIDAKELRTGRVMRQRIKSHLIPRFKDMRFVDVRRSDIARLLDDIEREHGAPMADAVLGIQRKMCNWYLSRNEDYTTPIVKEMRRSKPNRRTRKLDDKEIVTFWKATEELGTFGALARVCLLTGQRRAKVNLMKWSDIRDGVWHIETEPREKGNPGKLKLSKLALETIEAQPRIYKCPYVFAAQRGKGAFNAWGTATVELQDRMKKLLPHLQPFTTHDLRRSFRTALDRLGVQYEVKELAIGHEVGNDVTKRYAQHDYFEEIGKALELFADHVITLVTPPPAANVVSLQSKRRRNGV